MTPGGGTADVVIIGAGVVGTAIARTLARYSLDVVLVDAAGDVGTGTSKANTAILHTGFDAKPGSLESSLLARGSVLLRSYAAAAGIPVERTGRSGWCRNGPCTSTPAGWDRWTSRAARCVSSPDPDRPGGYAAFSAMAAVEVVLGVTWPAV